MLAASSMSRGSSCRPWELRWTCAGSGAGARINGGGKCDVCSKFNPVGMTYDSPVKI